jgi:integrase
MRVTLAAILAGSLAARLAGKLTAFSGPKYLSGVDRTLDRVADANLHFHDLRGTAATRFYVAGLSERVIAGIMGWAQEHVAKIIRQLNKRST